MPLPNKLQDNKWNPIEYVAIKLTQGDPTLTKVRDIILKKPARTLLRIGLTPNITSILGFFFALLAAALLGQPAWALIFIALNLFADGIDGVIARQQGSNSKYGAIIDISCDTGSNIIILIGINYFYLTNTLPVIFFISIITLHVITSIYKRHIINSECIVIGVRSTIGLGVFLILLLNSLDFITSNLMGNVFYHFFLIICSILLLIAIRDIFWIYRNKTN